jgi:hypothetical protein
MKVLTAWIERMNRRERVLSLVIAGLIFGLLNLFIWNWLLGTISVARGELATRQVTRKEQAIFMKERPLWAKRDEWLQRHQPVLKNSGEAQTGLLDELKQIASKYDILIENPAIGSGETTLNHQAVFASIETKSPWPPLVHFLYDVQQPNSFIVFEAVNLMIDSSDPTMMRGKFKVARWFAPAQRKKG